MMCLIIYLMPCMQYDLKTIDYWNFDVCILIMLEKKSTRIQLNK